MLVHQHGSWLFTSHSNLTVHSKKCLSYKIYITQKTMKDVWNWRYQILKNKMKGCGLNSLGWGQGTVTDCCESGNKASASITWVRVECVGGGCLTCWAGLCSMEYTMAKLVYNELKHRPYYELKRPMRLCVRCTCSVQYCFSLHPVTGLANNLQINTEHGCVHIPYGVLSATCSFSHRKYTSRI